MMNEDVEGGSNYPTICLEGLRKTTTNLSHVNHLSDPGTSQIWNNSANHWTSTSGTHKLKLIFWVNDTIVDKYRILGVKRQEVTGG